MLCLDMGHSGQKIVIILALPNSLSTLTLMHWGISLMCFQSSVAETSQLLCMFVWFYVATLSLFYTLALSVSRQLYL